jgi:hypothetical protein
MEVRKAGVLIGPENRDDGSPIVWVRSLPPPPIYGSVLTEGMALQTPKTEFDS